MAVSLLIQQLLPWGRTSNVLADLAGVQIREGTLATVVARTATSVEKVEVQITAALGRAPVILMDDTGRYVNHRRAWRHGTSTTTVTHDQVHLS